MTLVACANTNGPTHDDGSVKVTFSANGGAFADGKTSVTVKVDNDGGVAFDKTPRLDGNAFIGWYSGDIEFDPDASFAENVTFSARYVSGNTDAVYTALFDENSTVSVDINMSDKEWKKLNNDYVVFEAQNSKSPIYRMADNVTIGIDDGDGMLYYYYEEVGVRMACHPDDPAWPVFGLPRIITGEANLHRMCDMVPSPCNGVTLCTGSLGSNPKNDLPAIIRGLKGRIHFGHVRNLIHHAPGKFDEAAHLSSDGSFDMYEIMKAFYDIGFDGPIRPDHGRAIWGEVAMPGYGLYDRALGATYLNGLWEAIGKSQTR